MAKTTKRQGKDQGQRGNWIEEENLNYQAKKIRARINETAQIAERNFWEYIRGSFPEVVNSYEPSEVIGEFGKICQDAVFSWYLANSKLGKKLIDLIRNDKIKPREKWIIVGQNAEGWWAANPDPAIKAKDIDKIRVIIHKMTSKEELLGLLSNLGYKKENILEGILRV
jgi:hypothetical protein